MDSRERVRACYLHASLKYVNGDFLTNASLRTRFNVRASSTASRYIRESADAGMIKPFSEDAGRRTKRYVPYWA